MLESRIRALEGITPRGILGLTGEPGVGKTQFALTITARLSRSHRIALRLPPQERSASLERLSELGAETSNVLVGLGPADVTIIDDITILSLERSGRRLEEFLSGLDEPALIIAQVRYPLGTPALKIPRLRRYYVDARLEFDGRLGRVRGLLGKKPAFEYRITPAGFEIVPR